MKNTFLTLISLMLFLFFSNSLAASSADSLGLAGDHFSLEGAMELFKTSKNLEEF